MRPYFLPWVACARTGVGIAGCRWYLPIDGTRTRLHRKSSNAAGQADGSSWDHRNCWTRPLAIALPPNLAAKQLPVWIKRGEIYGASYCWFSGDWAHVSNFVAICICGWSAGFFNQGVHLSRRSVLG